MSAFSRIRKLYGVPAKRGMRVTYKSDKVGHSDWNGVITSASKVSDYLRIRFDGDTRTYPAEFHPQWNIVYHES